MTRLGDKKKELVLARLRASKKDYKISVGGKGVFGKKEIISNIEKETDLGLQIVETQINYLRDVANGKIYRVLNN